jgi:hypothetical protein
MIFEGIVYFTVVKAGRYLRGKSFAHPLGGYHCKMKTFVRWADREVRRW